jgi:acetyl-CoA carboxylase biotin carboxyl carrier protein
LPFFSLQGNVILHLLEAKKSPGNVVPWQDSKAEQGGVNWGNHRNSGGNILNKDDIEDLIAIMDRSSLSEIEIVDGKTKIVLRKNNQPSVPVLSPTLHQTYACQPQLQSVPIGEDVPVKTTPCENLHVIKSPLVGTFYAAPSPECDAFVHVGSRIEKDFPLCILEAMKVMNEIQSDVAGIIREILVQNGQPVEFGQPLFKMEIC